MTPKPQSAHARAVYSGVGLDVRGKTGRPIRVAATRRRSPSSPRLRAATADATKLSRRRRAEPRAEPRVEPH